VKQTRNKRLVL